MDGSYTIYPVNRSWVDTKFEDPSSYMSKLYINYHEAESTDIFPVVPSISSAEFSITDIVNQMVQGTFTNNGFIINTFSVKREAEQYASHWGGLWSSWYSSEYIIQSKRPKLTIIYTKDATKLTSIKEFKQPSVALNNRSFAVTTSQSEQFQVEIYSITGRQLFQKSCVLSKGLTKIDFPEDITTRVVLIRLKSKTVNWVQRFILK